MQADDEEGEYEGFEDEFIAQLNDNQPMVELAEVAKKKLVEIDESVQEDEAAQALR